jgi:hypothetical protein
VATSSPFVGTLLVREPYRNTHHNTGVIPEAETISWTDGKAKGRAKEVKSGKHGVAKGYYKSRGPVGPQPIRMLLL